MTKRFLTIIFVLTAFVFSANAQLRVFIDDNDGPFTNIRNAPKGKVVSKVSATSGIMLTVLYQKNGWWYIDGNDYWDPETDTGYFAGSTTGYWIHSSVLAVGTRNYGGEKLSLRKSPASNAPVIFSFKDERLLRPSDIRGSWVKVKTYDGKHEGWIEDEWLCGNSVTNCI